MKISPHLKDEIITLPAYIINSDDEGWTNAPMPFDGIVISLNDKERSWKGAAIPLEVLDLLVRQLKQRKEKQNESDDRR